MKSVDLIGEYDSAYSMRSDDNSVIVVTDRLTFQRREDELVATGLIDSDGCTMELTFKQELAGTWKERNEAGETLYGGDFEFVRDESGRLFGAWYMPETKDGKTEIATGTWTLIKYLGSAATR